MSVSAPPERPTEPPPELSSRALVARVLRDHLRPRWKGLAVAVLAAVTVAATTGMLAQILEPAVNDLIVRRKSGALLAIPLTILGIAALRAGAQVLQATLVNRIGHGVVGDIQQRLFASLLRADLARLRSQHTGGFVSAVLYDAGLIREAATNGVVNYTQHALTVLAMLIVMTSNDPVLAVLVLVAGPVASAVMRRFSKRTRKAAKGAMAETSNLSTAVMESLDGIKVVKIDNREAAEEARVAEVIARRQRHIIKGANARAAAAPTTELLMTAVTAAVLAYAGWRASTGDMNVGAFTAFMVALAAASQSLRQLANLQTVMSEGLTAARRLFAALDVQAEIGDRPGAAALPPVREGVRFEDVSFTYGAAVPAVRGVSLEVRLGEAVALVGPSGGGKSTLLNLIPRFYDVAEGRVTVDGRDVREVTLASLRDQVALVTQEPFLFDDTLRANIAHARPDATDAEVEAAARAADAHDFIAALPNGYLTEAGEAGARLSGGQRQRIAIARAFLKDAPILLLDEATSALDSDSEARVQAALRRLMQGRATLLIAHRLATVREADRIYVLEAGEVVESGTHDALLRRGGLYARLARAQNLDGAPAAPAAQPEPASA